MNTAVINIRIKSSLKKEAQKIAAELGLSLSTLINAYLKNLIITKTVTFSLEDGEPSPYFIQEMRKSEADIKTGRVITFKTPNKALNYLDKMIAKDNNAASN